MKAKIILFCLLLGGTFTLTAQTNVLDEVPVKAREFLKMKFPEATDAAWARIENDRFRARFRKQTSELEQHAAIFTAEGDWLETLSPIDISLLPEDVVPSATATHRGYDVARAYIVDNGGAVHLFELKMRKKGTENLTVRLNANGQVVTRVPVRK